MAAYATGSDLVKRYDVSLIGDLCSDGRESLDESVVPNHPNVATALLDASGEVDSALLAGARYTPAQLATLDGNSVYKLIRITCDIAMSILLTRRADTRNIELAEQVAKTSRGHLAALQRGENVFGIIGVSPSEASSIDLATVSSIEIDNLNLLPSRMPHYFPGSAQRTMRGN